MKVTMASLFSVFLGIGQRIIIIRLSFAITTLTLAVPVHAW
jgi:hypothetical protein